MWKDSGINLNRHIELHGENEHFHCGICASAFVRKDSLRKHYNSIHFAETFKNPKFEEKCIGIVKKRSTPKRSLPSSDEENIVSYNI